MAAGGQIRSSRAKVSFLSATFSVIASITRSRSARSSRLGRSPVIRPHAASRAAASRRPRSTRPSRLRRSAPRPRSRSAWLASTAVTGKPAWATTWTIPPPMSPHPTTPTLAIAIDAPGGQAVTARRSMRRLSSRDGPTPRRLLIDDQRADGVVLELRAPAEERQLDQERDARPRRRRPARRAGGSPPPCRPSPGGRPRPARAAPGWIASSWIASASRPYSSSYSTSMVLAGSLPSLRTGRSPAPSWSASGRRR